MSFDHTTADISALLALVGPHGVAVTELKQMVARSVSITNTTLDILNTSTSSAINNNYYIYNSPINDELALTTAPHSSPSQPSTSAATSIPSLGLQVNDVYASDHWAMDPFTTFLDAPTVNYDFFSDSPVFNDYPATSPLEHSTCNRDFNHIIQNSSDSARNRDMLDNRNQTIASTIQHPTNFVNSSHLISQNLNAIGSGGQNERNANYDNMNSSQIPQSPSSNFHNTTIHPDIASTTPLQSNRTQPPQQTKGYLTYLPTSSPRGVVSEHDVLTLLATLLTSDQFFVTTTHKNAQTLPRRLLQSHQSSDPEQICADLRAKLITEMKTRFIVKETKIMKNDIPTRYEVYQPLPHLTDIGIVDGRLLPDFEVPRDKGDDQPKNRNRNRNRSAIREKEDQKLNLDAEVQSDTMLSSASTSLDDAISSNLTDSVTAASSTPKPRNSTLSSTPRPSKSRKQSDSSASRKKKMKKQQRTADDGSEDEFELSTASSSSSEFTSDTESSFDDVSDGELSEAMLSEEEMAESSPNNSKVGPKGTATSKSKSEKTQADQYHIQLRHYLQQVRESDRKDREGVKLVEFIDQRSRFYGYDVGSVGNGKTNANSSFANNPQKYDIPEHFLQISSLHSRLLGLSHHSLLNRQEVQDDTTSLPNLAQSHHIAPTSQFPLKKPPTKPTNSKTAAKKATTANTTPDASLDPNLGTFEVILTPAEISQLILHLAFSTQTVALMEFSTLNHIDGFSDEASATPLTNLPPPPFPLSTIRIHATPVLTQWSYGVDQMVNYYANSFPQLRHNILHILALHSVSAFMQCSINDLFSPYQKFLHTSNNPVHRLILQNTGLLSLSLTSFLNSFVTPSLPLAADPALGVLGPIVNSNLKELQQQSASHLQLFLNVAHNAQSRDDLEPHDQRSTNIAQKQTTQNITSPNLSNSLLPSTSTQVPISTSATFAHTDAEYDPVHLFPSLIDSINKSDLTTLVYNSQHGDNSNSFQNNNSINTFTTFTTLNASKNDNHQSPPALLPTLFTPTLPNIPALSTLTDSSLKNTQNSIFQELVPKYVNSNSSNVSGASRQLEVLQLINRDITMLRHPVNYPQRTILLQFLTNHHQWYLEHYNWNVLDPFVKHHHYVGQTGNSAVDEGYISNNNNNNIKQVFNKDPKTIGIPAHTPPPHHHVSQTQSQLYFDLKLAAHSCDFDQLLSNHLSDHHPDGKKSTTDFSHSLAVTHPQLLSPLHNIPAYQLLPPKSADSTPLYTYPGLVPLSPVLFLNSTTVTQDGKYKNVFAGQNGIVNFSHAHCQIQRHRHQRYVDQQHDQLNAQQWGRVQSNNQGSIGSTSTSTSTSTTASTPTSSFTFPTSSLLSPPPLTSIPTRSSLVAEPNTSSVHIFGSKTAMLMRQLQYNQHKQHLFRYLELSECLAQISFVQNNTSVNSTSPDSGGLDLQPTNTINTSDTPQQPGLNSRKLDDTDKLDKSQLVSNFLRTTGPTSSISSLVRTYSKRLPPSQPRNTHEAAQSGSAAQIKNKLTTKILNTVLSLLPKYFPHLSAPSQPRYVFSALDLAEYYINSVITSPEALQSLHPSLATYNSNLLSLSSQTSPSLNSTFTSTHLAKLQTQLPGITLQILKTLSQTSKTSALRWTALQNKTVATLLAQSTTYSCIHQLDFSDSQPYQLDAQSSNYGNLARLTLKPTDWFALAIEHAQSTLFSPDSSTHLRTVSKQRIIDSSRKFRAIDSVDDDFGSDFSSSTSTSRSSSKHHPSTHPNSTPNDQEQVFRALIDHHSLSRSQRLLLSPDNLLISPLHNALYPLTVFQLALAKNMLRKQQFINGTLQISFLDLTTDQYRRSVVDDRPRMQDLAEGGQAGGNVGRTGRGSARFLQNPKASADSGPRPSRRGTTVTKKATKTAVRGKKRKDESEDGEYSEVESESDYDDSTDDDELSFDDDDHSDDDLGDDDDISSDDLSDSDDGERGRKGNKGAKRSTKTKTKTPKKAGKKSNVSSKATKPSTRRSRVDLADVSGFQVRMDDVHSTQPNNNSADGKGVKTDPYDTTSPPVQQSSTTIPNDATIQPSESTTTKDEQKTPAKRRKSSTGSKKTSKPLTPSSTQQALAESSNTTPDITVPVVYPDFPTFNTLDISHKGKMYRDTFQSVTAYNIPVMPLRYHSFPFQQAIEPRLHHYCTNVEFFQLQRQNVELARLNQRDQQIQPFGIDLLHIPMHSDELDRDSQSVSPSTSPLRPFSMADLGADHDNKGGEIDQISKYRKFSSFSSDLNLPPHLSTHTTSFPPLCPLPRSNIHHLPPAQSFPHTNPTSHSLQAHLFSSQYSTTPAIISLPIYRPGVQPLEAAFCLTRSHSIASIVHQIIASNSNFAILTDDLISHAPKLDTKQCTRMVDQLLATGLIAGLFSGDFHYGCILVTSGYSQDLPHNTLYDTRLTTPHTQSPIVSTYSTNKPTLIQLRQLLGPGISLENFHQSVDQRKTYRFEHGASLNRKFGRVLVQQRLLDQEYAQQFVLNNGILLGESGQHLSKDEIRKLVFISSNPYKNPLSVLDRRGRPVYLSSLDEQTRNDHVLTKYTTVTDVEQYLAALYDPLHSHTQHLFIKPYEFEVTSSTALTLCLPLEHKVWEMNLTNLTRATPANYGAHVRNPIGYQDYDDSDSDFGHVAQKAAFSHIHRRYRFTLEPELKQAHPSAAPKTYSERITGPEASGDGASLYQLAPFVPAAASRRTRSSVSPTSSNKRFSDTDQSGSDVDDEGRSRRGRKVFEKAPNRYLIKTPDGTETEIVGNSSGRITKWDHLGGAVAAYKMIREKYIAQQNALAAQKERRQLRDAAKKAVIEGKGLNESARTGEPGDGSDKQLIESQNTTGDVDSESETDPILLEPLIALSDLPKSLQNQIIQAQRAIARSRGTTALAEGDDAASAKKTPRRRLKKADPLDDFISEQVDGEPAVQSRFVSRGGAIASETTSSKATKTGKATKTPTGTKSSRAIRSPSLAEPKVEQLENNERSAQNQSETAARRPTRRSMRLSQSQLPESSTFRSQVVAQTQDDEDLFSQSQTSELPSTTNNTAPTDTNTAPLLPPNFAPTTSSSTPKKVPLRRSSRNAAKIDLFSDDVDDMFSFHKTPQTANNSNKDNAKQSHTTIDAAPQRSILSMFKKAPQVDQTRDVGTEKMKSADLAALVLHDSQLQMNNEINNNDSLQSQKPSTSDPTANSASTTASRRSTRRSTTTISTNIIPSHPIHPFLQSPNSFIHDSSSHSEGGELQLEKVAAHHKSNRTANRQFKTTKYNNDPNALSSSKRRQHSLLPAVADDAVGLVNDGTLEFKDSTQPPTPSTPLTDAISSPSNTNTDSTRNTDPITDQTGQASTAATSAAAGHPVLFSKFLPYIHDSCPLLLQPNRFDLAFEHLYQYDFSPYVLDYHNVILICQQLKHLCQDGSLHDNVLSSLETELVQLLAGFILQQSKNEHNLVKIYDSQSSFLPTLDQIIDSVLAPSAPSHFAYNQSETEQKANQQSLQLSRLLSLTPPSSELYDEYCVPLFQQANLYPTTLHIGINQQCSSEQFKLFELLSARSQYDHPLFSYHLTDRYSPLLMFSSINHALNGFSSTQDHSSTATTTTTTTTSSATIDPTAINTITTSTTASILSITSILLASLSPLQSNHTANVPVFMHSSNSLTSQRKHPAFMLPISLYTPPLDSRGHFDTLPVSLDSNVISVLQVSTPKAHDDAMLLAQTIFKSILDTISIAHSASSHTSALHTSHNTDNASQEAHSMPQSRRRTRHSHAAIQSSQAAQSQQDLHIQEESELHRATRARRSLRSPTTNTNSIGDGAIKREMGDYDQPPASSQLHPNDLVQLTPSPSSRNPLQPVEQPKLEENGDSLVDIAKTINDQGDLPQYGSLAQYDDLNKTPYPSVFSRHPLFLVRFFSLVDHVFNVYNDLIANVSFYTSIHQSSAKNQPLALHETPNSTKIITDQLLQPHPAHSAPRSILQSLSSIQSASLTAEPSFTQSITKLTSLQLGSPQSSLSNHFSNNTTTTTTANAFGPPTEFTAALIPMSDYNHHHHCEFYPPITLPLIITSMPFRTYLTLFGINTSKSTQLQISTLLPILPSLLNLPIWRLPQEFKTILCDTQQVSRISKELFRLMQTAINQYRCFTVILADNTSCLYGTWSCGQHCNPNPTELIPHALATAQTRSSTTPSLTTTDLNAAHPLITFKPDHWILSSEFKTSPISEFMTTFSTSNLQDQRLGRYVRTTPLQHIYATPLHIFGANLRKRMTQNEKNIFQRDELILPSHAVIMNERYYELRQHSISLQKVWFDKAVGSTAGTNTGRIPSTGLSQLPQSFQSYFVFSNQIAHGTTSLQDAYQKFNFLTTPSTSTTDNVQSLQSPQPTELVQSYSPAMSHLEPNVERGQFTQNLISHPIINFISASIDSSTIVPIFLPSARHYGSSPFSIQSMSDADSTRTEHNLILPPTMHDADFNSNLIQQQISTHAVQHGLNPVNSLSFDLFSKLTHYHMIKLSQETSSNTTSSSATSQIIIDVSLAVQKTMEVICQMKKVNSLRLGRTLSLLFGVEPTNMVTADPITNSIATFMTNQPHFGPNRQIHFISHPSPSTSTSPRNPAQQTTTLVARSALRSFSTGVERVAYLLRYLIPPLLRNSPQTIETIHPTIQNTSNPNHIPATVHPFLLDTHLLDNIHLPSDPSAPSTPFPVLRARDFFENAAGTRGNTRSRESLSGQNASSSSSRSQPVETPQWIKQLRAKLTHQQPVLHGSADPIDVIALSSVLPVSEQSHESRSSSRRTAISTPTTLPSQQPDATEKYLDCSALQIDRQALQQVSRAIVSSNSFSLVLSIALSPIDELLQFRQFLEFHSLSISQQSAVSSPTSSTSTSTSSPSTPSAGPHHSSADIATLSRADFYASIIDYTAQSMHSTQTIPAPADLWDHTTLHHNLPKVQPLPVLDGSDSVITPVSYPHLGGMYNLTDQVHPSDNQNAKQRHSNSSSNPNPIAHPPEFESFIHPDRRQGFMDIIGLIPSSLLMLAVNVGIELYNHIQLLVYSVHEFEQFIHHQLLNHYEEFKNFHEKHKASSENFLLSQIPQPTSTGINPGHYAHSYQSLFELYTNLKNGTTLLTPQSKQVELLRNIINSRLTWLCSQTLAMLNPSVAAAGLSLFLRSSHQINSISTHQRIFNGELFGMLSLLNSSSSHATVASLMIFFTNYLHFQFNYRCNIPTQTVGQFHDLVTSLTPTPHMFLHLNIYLLQFLKQSQASLYQTIPKPSLQNDIIPWMKESFQLYLRSNTANRVELSHTVSATTPASSTFEQSDHDLLSSMYSFAVRNKQHIYPLTPTISLLFTLIQQFHQYTLKHAPTTSTHADQPANELIAGVFWFPGDFSTLSFQQTHLQFFAQPLSPNNITITSPLTTRKWSPWLFCPTLHLLATNQLFASSLFFYFRQLFIVPMQKPEPVISYTSKTQKEFNKAAVDQNSTQLLVQKAILSNPLLLLFPASPSHQLTESDLRMQFQLENHQLTQNIMEQCPIHSAASCTCPFFLQQFKLYFSHTIMHTGLVNTLNSIMYPISSNPSLDDENDVLTQKQTHLESLLAFTRQYPHFNRWIHHYNVQSLTKKSSLIVSSLFHSMLQGINCVNETSHIPSTIAFNYYLDMLARAAFKNIESNSLSTSNSQSTQPRDQLVHNYDAVIQKLCSLPKIDKASATANPHNITSQRVEIEHFPPISDEIVTQAIYSPHHMAQMSSFCNSAHGKMITGQTSTNSIQIFCDVSSIPRLLSTMIRDNVEAIEAVDPICQQSRNTTSALSESGQFFSKTKSISGQRLTYNLFSMLTDENTTSNDQHPPISIQLHTTTYHNPTTLIENSRAGASEPVSIKTSQIHPRQLEAIINLANISFSIDFAPQLPTSDGVKLSLQKKAPITIVAIDSTASDANSATYNPNSAIFTVSLIPHQHSSIDSGTSVIYSDSYIHSTVKPNEDELIRTFEEINSMMNHHALNIQSSNYIFPQTSSQAIHQRVALDQIQQDYAEFNPKLLEKSTTLNAGFNQKRGENSQRDKTSGSSDSIPTTTPCPKFSLTTLPSGIDAWKHNSINPFVSTPTEFVNHPFKMLTTGQYHVVNAILHNKRDIPTPLGFNLPPDLSSDSSSPSTPQTNPNQQLTFKWLKLYPSILQKLLQVSKTLYPSSLASRTRSYHHFSTDPRFIQTYLESIAQRATSIAFNRSPDGYDAFDTTSEEESDNDEQKSSKRTPRSKKGQPTSSKKSNSTQKPSKRSSTTTRSSTRTSKRTSRAETYEDLFANDFGFLGDDLENNNDGDNDQNQVDQLDNQTAPNNAHSATASFDHNFIFAQSALFGFEDQIHDGLPGLEDADVFF